MKKIYYEKRGRRYMPVSEYDSELFNSMSKGNHLVMCYPGGHSIRYDINPNHAAMIAAGRVAEFAMTDALHFVMPVKNNCSNSGVVPTQ